MLFFQIYIKHSFLVFYEAQCDLRKYLVKRMNFYFYGQNISLEWNYAH